MTVLFHFEGGPLDGTERESEDPQAATKLDTDGNPTNLSLKDNSLYMLTHSDPNNWYFLWTLAVG